eukprot:EG_transcript_32914
MSAPVGATESAGDVEGEGKHLIILLHGVFGAASDWDNWVKVWTIEVQLRNGLTPQVSSARNRPKNRMGHRLQQYFKNDSESSESASQTARPEKRPGWEKALQSELFVVQLKDLTLRGIEHLAVQSCIQVERFLSRRPREFRAFSLIGHSFGGIYSKHLLTIRRQYAHFASLAPRNFVSLASPHLSSCTTWTRA